MLETLVENQIIFYAMGAAVGIGVFSKLITHITLRRMVKAASRMNKSSHKLMRLVRAKFEHASMISDKVQNVEAFVKKYIYEYRIFGIRLHTFRNLEKKMIWIVAVLGAVGTAAMYYVYGAGEQVLQYGTWAGVSVVVLCMIHMASDENYRLQMAENYMIDYLENFCAHRYAKLYKEKAMSQTSIVQMEEAFKPEAEEEVTVEVAEAVQEEKAEEVTVQPESICDMKQEEQGKEEKEKRLQEVQVRRILEEFLA